MTLDDDPVQIWRPYLQQLPAHHDPSSFILANLEDQVLNGVPRVLTRRNETLVRVTDVYDGGYNQSPSVAAYELTPKSRKIIVSLDQNDKALVDLPDESTPRESYKTVSELRNLNDFALRAHICCRGNLDLVSALKPVIASSLGRRTLDSAGQALPGCEVLLSALQSYIQSCEELIPRMRNAIDLAGYTLSLHNQLETARVDRELRDLTSSLKRLQEDNMNDSAAVKVITFVSAIYLPGSFIVSLYGMNFFVFDEDLRQIVIAKDFWVFLATWLPLTLVTGLIYVLIVWFDAWWKRKPFRFFQRPGKEDMSESEMQVGKEFADD
ncbi:similar to An11g01260 [Aspergillus luchuensis]|nr:similar to An11g01260 [Aspergillus luchuensis]